MVQARAQKLASLLFAGFALCSIYAVRAEDVIYMNTAGGTANYGPETHIEKTGSAQRILVY